MAVLSQTAPGVQSIRMANPLRWSLPVAPMIFCMCAAAVRFLNGFAVSALSLLCRNVEPCL